VLLHINTPAKPRTLSGAKYSRLNTMAVSRLAVFFKLNFRSKYQLESKVVKKNIGII
jgi:hypothetical protein